MNDLGKTFNNMLWNLTHRMGIVDILDILIMAVIVYEILILLRNTRSSALLKGLFFLTVIAVGSSLMGLTSLNWLLSSILNNGALVLLVLFQPEIRKALETMGRSTLLSRRKGGAGDANRERIITEIIQTAVDLSRRKVGLLIAFERKTGLQDVIETGTMVDAEISAPLLENIFEPNTPLHDGAVVIRGERVQAAACIIQTLTEARGVSRELGTRHRAAIGLSENTDATVLIVSEETGTISIARGGELTRDLNAASLRKVLEEIYTDKQFHLLSFLHLNKKDKKEATV